MSLLWITKAEYIKDYQLNLQFNNDVNLEDKLNKKMFEPLKDKNLFKKFRLNSWTIEWENGADFSPEFLYGILIKK